MGYFPEFLSHGNQSWDLSRHRIKTKNYPISLTKSIDQWLNMQFSSIFMLDYCMPVLLNSESRLHIFWDATWQMFELCRLLLISRTRQEQDCSGSRYKFRFYWFSLKMDEKHGRRRFRTWKSWIFRFQAWVLGFFSLVCECRKSCQRNFLKLSDNWSNVIWSGIPCLVFCLLTWPISW